MRPEFRGFFARGLEEHVEGSGREVEQVDGDLRLPVLIDVPADGTDGLESARHLDGGALGVAQDLALRIPLRSSTLPDVQGDFVRQAPIESVQVDVVREQERARPHHRAARSRVEPGGTGIGRPRRAGEFVGEALVFARADSGEAAARLGRRRLLVEVHGNLQLVSDAPSDRPGEIGALGHRDVRDGDERADIERAHAWMRALVDRHVDEFGRLLRAAERGLGHPVRRADQRVNRAVRVRARVDVQQLHSGDARQGLGDGVDGAAVAPFGEIRNTLNQSSHADTFRMRRRTALPAQRTSAAAVRARGRKGLPRRSRWGNLQPDSGEVGRRRVSWIPWPTAPRPARRHPG